MKIALTGGAAQGKSTVLSIFKELGVETASSDEIAAEVFAQPSVQNEISKIFDLPIPIDRATLRKKMLTNDNFRHALNNLMHPLVFSQIAASKASVIEVPLLLEACLQNDFDRVWNTICEPKVQLIRLTQRFHGDEAAAEKLIEAQIPARIRTLFADAEIRTDCPIPDVFEMSRHLVHICGLVKV